MQKNLNPVKLTGNYEIDKTRINLPLDDLKARYKFFWNENYLENEIINNADELLEEIIDYSLYHKKDIVSNTNSYFNLILSNSIKILKIINE